MTDSTSHSMQHSADPREPDPDFIKWLKEYCVPIIGIAFSALLLCLLAHYSSKSFDWTKTKDFAVTFANLNQSLALIVAGVWAYFKFAKGRTFRDRLIPNVSGRLVSLDGCVFMIITTEMKNVGLSRIALDQEVSSLKVFEYVPSEVDEILSVKNNKLTTFKVFGDKDRYIEPNEVTERQTLVALPQVARIGYRLEFDVSSDSGYTWRATGIVDASTLDDNEVG